MPDGDGEWEILKKLAAVAPVSHVRVIGHAVTCRGRVMVHDKVVRSNVKVGYLGNPGNRDCTGRYVRGAG